MSAFRKFNLSATLDKTLGHVSKIGDTVLDLQMKKALLDEQRDRTSVETSYYVPGPMDAQYTTPAPVMGNRNISIGGMEITPLQLGLGALALFMLVKS